MTQILDNLVALLSLEPIVEILFRGMSLDLGFRQLYGGQVLGQEPISLSHTLLLFIHLVGMYLCEKEAALSGSFFCCLQPFLGQAAKSLPLIQQLLIQQVQAHAPQHLVV